MENELFMNSMLPPWHSQEIPLPEHLSYSLVDKTAADNNPLTNFNSLSAAHVSPSPVNNGNSLLRELIGNMANAGKFSSFGTGSFNGRQISRFCPKRSEGVKDHETEGQDQLSSSQEDRILEGGGMGVDLRKRKSALRLIKVEEDTNSKRAKQIEDCCIHVRARKGQATDNHKLAERLRREKIGERMKFLQNLVPGCNKVTGKAVKLDEIINYVQSLQRQVQFLSMKLAYMNSVGNDSNGNFNVETLLLQNHILPLNLSNASTINPALHAPPQFNNH